MTTRRDLLRATAGLPLLGSSGLAVAESGSTAGGLAAAATTPVVAGVRRPDTTRLPQRIAFGSCAEGAVPQPIWEAVLAADPDLFIFLGDNIYGDTRDPAVLSAKYAQFAAQPGFRRLCDRVPVLATWDDHDYGEDDAGADYPMKEVSQRIFCDFWGEPTDSLRRTRDGIYDAVEFSAGGRRLQVLLPDLRFNRTPIRMLDLGGKKYDDWMVELERAGRPVPGPYERNPDPQATMLGARQWQWLEAQLARPADLRVFASSLQVVADFPGWEAWINYAEDHQRLLQTIRSQRANGLLCLSGDTHYAEASCLRTNAPYPLWDFTSSGLTETWPVLPPNSQRVGEAWREPNFGLLQLDWSDPAAVRVTAQVRDVTGAARIEQRLDTRELRVVS
ncbi:MAG: alkaline phosphatase D family protein [Proteobacteria bacterium]|nr:alkaline phosphatase D family protein [Pseudomonadota bacterium]